MLGRNYTFNIFYDDRDIEIEFTVRAIKNIFDLVKYSPFQYLIEFLKLETDKEKEVYVAQILYCITDGKLDIFDVLNNLLNDKEILDTIYNGLLTLINLELISEVKEVVDEEEQEEEQEEIKEFSKQERNKSFIDWWNYFYYISKVQLHLTYEEMLNLTVRELKSLEILNKQYYKNILIDTYITITKNKTKAIQKEQEEEKDLVISGNLRFKDLVMR